VMAQAREKKEERLMRARILVSRGHFRLSHDPCASESTGDAASTKVQLARGRGNASRGRGRYSSTLGRAHIAGSQSATRPCREPRNHVWQPKSARALDLASSSAPLVAQSGDNDDLERPILPIHRINVYDTLGELGKGQFGVVSQAVRRKGSSATSKVVAIKMLKFDFDREGFPLEALREITLLSSLQHPNIVRMHAVACGMDDAPIGWHLVMEPAGHELTTLVKGARRRPMTEAQVKHLMLQLLRALAALHSVWVMHRDLKTPNVLIDDRGVLRLCDFGLARRVCCGLELESMSELSSTAETQRSDLSKRKFFADDDAMTVVKRSRQEAAQPDLTIPSAQSRKYNQPHATHTPNVISGHYRPPEILLGCRDYGRSIDLWSAGCIFAELLSRQVLFPGKDEPDQLRIIFDLLGEPSDKEWPLYSHNNFV